MKKLTLSVGAVIIGVLLLSGFSTDNHSPKNAPSNSTIANDYASFTQYMQ